MSYPDPYQELMECSGVSLIILPIKLLTCMADVAKITMPDYVHLYFICQCNNTAYSKFMLLTIIYLLVVESVVKIYSLL